MTITKNKHKKILKQVIHKSNYPATEMTTSIADHNKNKMQLLPIEQQLMYNILEEIKQIKELLKTKLV